jgi:agmatine deiminase
MYQNLTFSFILSLLLSVTTLSAQDLPNANTPQELEAAVHSGVNYTVNFRNNDFITTPPPKPLRAMAEWEELQGVTIAWKADYNTAGWHTILTQIVKAAQQEVMVYIACKTSDVAAIKAKLQAANIDLTKNISFVEGDFDTIWIRDYGANPAYSNNTDSLLLVDWVYNRKNRIKDDTLSAKVAKTLNVPIYATLAKPFDLVHTGGNFMSDGLGTGFSSKLILEENDGTLLSGEVPTTAKTEAEVDKIMADFMGINRYIKMENLPYDGIHHIDMHLKLLDEETLLVGKYPEGTLDGPQIEKNIEYIQANYKTPYGNPYKIVRVLMPPKNGVYTKSGDYRTYANATFLNKTVIVPFYEQKYDTTALKVWQEALPGYTIVGINCNSIINSLGALHCITKEIGANNPIWITHEKMTDARASCSPDGYALKARVEHHHQGIAKVNAFYTTDLAAGFTQSVAMLPSAEPNHYEALLPTQPNGTNVYYYIEAEGNDGKKINRPLPAPQAYWKFKVSKCTVASNELTDINVQPLYPNPTTRQTSLSIHSNLYKNIHISLQDALGRTVETLFQGQTTLGTQTFTFDVASQPKGMYFVKVQTTDGGVLVQKLVIQ